MLWLDHTARNEDSARTNNITIIVGVIFGVTAAVTAEAPSPFSLMFSYDACVYAGAHARRRRPAGRPFPAEPASVLLRDPNYLATVVLILVTFVTLTPD